GCPLDAAACVATDGNDPLGLRPHQPIHPDRRRHRSRARVDSLPHAPGRPAITPARRHLPLALLEAIARECTHDLLGSRGPALLCFAPGHPAAPTQLVE